MVDIPNVGTRFNLRLEVTCTAEGGPNNMFEWRRQGMVISNSSVLEIPMITGSDRGAYECTVTNDAGTDTANTTVTGMYT